MCPTKSPLLARELPFHPITKLGPFIDKVVDELKKPNQEPAPVIAVIIMELLENHIDKNLKSCLPVLTKIYGTTKQDLKMYNYGYTYVLNTVIISALCKDINSKAERYHLFNSKFNPSKDPLVWSMQNKMQSDLTATVNLFNLDPSAAFVFKHLEEYPFSTNPYFLAGLEVASIIFFTVSQEASDRMPEPEKTWLHVWQGISTMS